MDAYEQAVMSCLVANGETFVSPEMELGGGWSRADFVAIRPPKRQVYIVEVTASGKPTGLLEKVNNRDKQWLIPLKSHLENRRICDNGWSYRVLAFVRRDQFEWFKPRITGSPNVTVLCVEDAITHWEWDNKI